VFDTKYAYNFWRPVTAIRKGNTDGNPLTSADDDWLSYQNTPPYPDYTCGLTNNVGAGLAVLRSYFETDRIAYTLTTASGLTRSYRSLSQAGFEAVDARVFGGMHFRTGCVRGLMRAATSAVTYSRIRCGRVARKVTARSRSASGRARQRAPSSAQPSPSSL
jgi:hypothetical protein